jgi:ribosome-associated protein
MRPTGTRRSFLEGADIARRIVDLLAEKQAEDVLLLDISKVTSFADYFVIASAVNVRQMQALLEALDEALTQEGLGSLRREGDLDSGWVLADLGDVIVHLFSPEQRAYYGIERLWSSGTQVVRIQ